jgi:SAM-dependent methyltransferase
MTSMQSDRTLQFWDDYHKENEGKEWILQPSVELLDQLADKVPDDKPSIRILEIGCGTSTLARDLWEHVQTKHPDQSVHVCATDVSAVCIASNQQRDEDLLSLAAPAPAAPRENGSTLEYKVLNVLEPNEEDLHQNKFDMIIDKGCVDTFLFRSRQRGENHVYTNLLHTVLDHLHIWMTPSDGMYLLISPRSRLRAVRDYAGFGSVQRQVLATAKAELVGDNDTGYLYTSQTNDKYQPGISTPFPGNYREVPKDDSICPHCEITFGEMRKGEAVEGRGQVYWTRQWKGHCIHCKAPHKSPWGAEEKKKEAPLPSPL